MSGALTLPAPLKTFFSYFPLYTHPPIKPFVTSPEAEGPNLWIHPPADSSLLSAEVECLKWQAYLALRGLSNLSVRWDIAADGGIDGRLPNLHIPSTGELLDAQKIPGWVDQQTPPAPLEGYKDEDAKNESNAWISLLETTVHAALVVSEPETSFLTFILSTSSSKAAEAPETLLNPPPAPLTGISSLFPPFGKKIDLKSIERDYKAAIAALSERLGTDRWFLDSPTPTALDALLFAYLHSILQAKDTVRFEVTRRVNLVSWERRVEAQVKATLRKQT